jgi:hypothetical protein
MKYQLVLHIQYLIFFFIVMKQLSVYTLRSIPIVKTVLLFHIKTEKCDSESSWTNSVNIHI